MSTAALAVLWVLLGAAVGGAVVAIVLRARGAGGGASALDVEAPEVVTSAPEVSAPPVSDEVPSAVAPGSREAVTAPEAEAPAPEPAPAEAPAMEPPSVPPPVPVLRTRPHLMDPERIGATSLVAFAGLGVLAADTGPDAATTTLSDEDRERLAAAVAAVADGGVLAIPGPVRTVLRSALRDLHATLGDVPAFGVPAPRRAASADTGREPFRALVADASPLAAAGRCVVVVEDAELHLRRGLDAQALDGLHAGAPSAVVLLVVGACEHDAASIDDAGRWLDRMVLDVGGDRVAAAGAHDAALDLPLMDAVGDVPLLADLAEAAASASAAGLLPDVPLDVAARVASLLAGGRADEPAAAHQLGAALAADVAEPPLLRFDALDASGLPVTVRASSVLVARCVADPAVLGSDVLAVLLEGGLDDVERLLVARRLTAGERPGLALPVLDALVEHTDAAIATEARLVRGVARDRLGLASAADDYHAVAVGRRGTLAAHGAFLLGGILETADDLEPARAAYRTAIAAGDPTHSAMAAFNLAWLEEREGRTDVALDAYREVAAGGHPDAAPMAALNLGTLLERGKRFAEAESWYRAAADARHPDASPMAALSLGLMLERRQRPREARALFRQAAGSGHVEAAPLALRRLGAPRR